MLVLQPQGAVFECLACRAKNLACCDWDFSRMESTRVQASGMACSFRNMSSAAFLCNKRLCLSMVWQYVKARSVYVDHQLVGIADQASMPSKQSRPLPPATSAGKETAVDSWCDRQAGSTA